MQRSQVDDSKIVRIYALCPKKRKSFYEKCKVLEFENGDMYLQSYETIVAQVVDKTLKVLEWHSQTTTRHIWAFIDFLGSSCRDKALLMEGVKL